MDKTRILFYGDGPQVATGFGTVSRNILVPLAETGKYDITVMGINYWGEPHEFHNLPTWPVGMNKDKDPYGRKLVQERIKSSDFDILFMIQDSFILEFVRDFIPELKYSKKFKSVIYFPIDGIPKKNWVEAMSVADYPVTYTDFGFNECAKAYPPIADKLRTIPHGINVDDFYPALYSEMLAFRSKYFGPLADRFIITNVNRNQQRKDIPRTIMAFSELKKRLGPDKAVLYLHMAINDQGWKLDEVVKSCGLEINRDVIFPVNFGPNQGFPRHILNLIYNCSDVVVSSTTGEGWGLAQVEAMAAKTPVLSPDNTACTEVLGASKGGLLVESGKDMEHHVVLPHDNEVIRPIISIKDMVDKLEMLYNDEVLRFRLGEQGHDWVRENLVWERDIVPKWESVIDEAVESLNTDSDELNYNMALEV